MEDIVEKIKKIKLYNCEHRGNESNMICVDKYCMEKGDNRYMRLMCGKCIEENVHEKQNHIHKPFHTLISLFISQLSHKQQEYHRIHNKFTQIYDFINSLKATLSDEVLKKRTDKVFESLTQSAALSDSNKFVDNVIQVVQDIEYNEDTSEVSFKNNLNQSIDSDVADSHIANELFKDFEKLIEIYHSNNHSFDQNIITPLQNYRLLSDVKDSPLGSIQKEKLFKDAYRIDSVITSDVKGVSGSRRQSLEMFEADKKILLLMNENDRLNFSLNAKQDEIDILKIKLQRADDDLIQNHNINPDDEDPQVKILQFELERVNKALEYKNQEIDSLYQRNSSKIAENGETIIELQAQIDMLIKENERLNSVIFAKDEEIGSIQSVSNLEDRTSEGLKAEIIRLNKIVADQNARMENMKGENVNIIETKNVEIQQQKDKYSSLYQKYSLFGSQIDKLSKEIERLNLEIQQKTNEIDQWKSKIPKGMPKDQSKDSTRQIQNQPMQSYVPLTSPTISNHHSIPHYTQYTASNVNNVNPSKLFNNYGSAFQSAQASTQAFNNRERLGSEGQLVNHKIDQIKSASHIKKISAIDKIDIYKKEDYLQQPLSSRFRSTPYQSGNKNQMNKTSTNDSMNDYEVQNKSLMAPTIYTSMSNNNSQIGLPTSHTTIDYKSTKITNNNNNNINQDDKFNNITSNMHYYKTYKQNSQLNSPPTQVQSIIPYKERIDNKIQNLSNEIGKLNHILDNRDQPDKKSSQLIHQNFIKQQNNRSGSEGLKNKHFK